MLDNAYYNSIGNSIDDTDSIIVPCKVPNRGVMMKNNPFNLDKSFAEWDSIHYETICMVIVGHGTIDTEEVVEGMLVALCQTGLLEAGDSFGFSKSGDMIVIGKACANISIDFEDTIN